MASNKRLKGDSNCTRCPLHKTTKRVCVMGKGRAPNKIMIIGEAPGANEEKTGKPFMGRAGHLLDEVLDEAGIDSNKVYISNAVHCRPPDNKTPTSAQIRHCNFWLQYEIAAVKPKFVLLLGNVALESITGEKGIKKKRGIHIEKDGIIYFPIYHPAYVLYDERQRTVFEKDVNTFAKMIEKGGPLEEEGVDYVIVDKSTYKDALYQISQETTAISYDTETSGLDPFAPGGWVASLGIGISDYQFCFPLNHYLSPNYKKFNSQRRIVKGISKAVKDSSAVKVAQNGKFDDLWLWNTFGEHWVCEFDTMLAHYNLDENLPHDLDFLSQTYFDANNYNIPLTDKWGLTGTLESHCNYLALDLFYTRNLFFEFTNKFEDEDEFTSKRLFYNFTMPASRLYTEIQMTGIYVDPEKLIKAEKYWETRANYAERKLDELVPSENTYKDKRTGKIRKGVNWGSPQQLAEVLFDKLKIKPIEKTDAGANSTKESVLLRLRKKHKVPDLVLKYREASKNLSTFIRPWMALAIKNRLHPNFKIHGTVAGRPSAEEPNPQQTPRNPRIRSIVCAEPGWVMVSADYSQVELRLTADDSQDHELMMCYQTGVDVHTRTVQNIMGIKDPTKEQRKKGKAINFGFIYGMWWKGFIDYARDKFEIIVSPGEAQSARKGFFRLYKGLQPWQKRKKRFAKIEGYVMNKIGRKRRLPHAMRNDNSYECKEAERQAVNAPIQGLASDINILSAIEIRKVFPRKYLRIVSTTHDEILMEIKREKLKMYLPRIKAIMEDFDRVCKVFKCSPLSVPLVAEFSIGPWGGKDNFEWHGDKKQLRELKL